MSGEDIIMGSFGSPEEARAYILERVVVDANGCWRWKLKARKNGYAIVVRHLSGKRKPQARAHRLSYLAFKGAIAEECVCHSCDVRDCVNPDHLWLGSHQDNIADRDAKERAQRGREHYLAKLRPADITTAFSLAARHHSESWIARLLGVSSSAMAAILERRTWKHVEVPADLQESVRALREARRAA